LATNVTIRVRDNGPLLVEGLIVLLDGEGQELPRDPAKPAVALCRCAQSKNAPFCDGSHKLNQFQSCVRAGTQG
jgi:CDGSH iron-sulfur domain-containing protein 3